MSRIAVDPDTLAIVAGNLRAETETAREVLAAMPASVDGGDGSDAIVDVMVLMSTWLGVLGQVEGTLANIVDDIADGTREDDEAVAAELQRVASEIGIDP